MANRKRRGRKRGQGIVAYLRDPKKIRMLYIIVGLALVFGGSLGFGNASCQRIRQQQQKNAKTATAPVQGTDTIASIGDRKISKEEYDQELQQARTKDESGSGQDQQGQPSAVIHPPEYDADTNYRVLHQLLDMQYFEIRAKEAGITITSQQVDDRMKYYENMFMPAQTSNEERSLLQRFLDALGTVKKDQQFEQALKTNLQDPNMTLSKFRGLVTEELTAQAYLKKLSDQEQGKINDGLTTQLTSIRSEIEGGTDFQDAAKKYSQDTSATAGGLIPLIKHNNADLPKGVVDAAFSLPVSEISQPILTATPEAKRGGWLISVTSRKEASGPDWDAAKEPLRQQLLEAKRKQVEAGKAQMPASGSLTVSDDEVKNSYEEATIRAIFIKGDDPMNSVQKIVAADMKNLPIKIYDPELRATHHIANEEWSLAIADYLEALQANQDNLAPDKSNKLEIDLNEARLRYLMGNLWGSRAFKEEAAWFQNQYQMYQANPGSIAKGFPETPPEIKAAQQGYFVLSLRELDNSVELK